MKVKTIVVALAAVAAAAGALVLFKTPSPADDGRAVEQGERRARKPREGAAPGDSAARPARIVSPRRMRLRDATNGVSRVRRKKLRVEDTYTPQERRLADGLQDASDDNDLEKVRKAVKEIMSQKNPELKVEAISTLGFFGKESLNDLMVFLKDPSQEVVDQAADAISRSLDELEDDEKEFKAEFISSLLSVDGLCSKDNADIFVGQLESIGSSDEKLAVQTIVQLIEDKSVGKGVKARLKEAYEFVTSEEYTTFEAAEKWFEQKVEEEQADADEAELPAEDTGSDTETDDDGKGDSDDSEQTRRTMT